MNFEDKHSEVERPIFIENIERRRECPSSGKGNSPLKESQLKERGDGGRSTFEMTSPLRVLNQSNSRDHTVYFTL
jgi:hypothetical protein